jgi:hypothetical protein
LTSSAQERSLHVSWIEVSAPTPSILYTTFCMPFSFVAPSPTPPLPFPSLTPPWSLHRFTAWIPVTMPFSFFLYLRSAGSYTSSSSSFDRASMECAQVHGIDPSGLHISVAVSPPRSNHYDDKLE